MLFVIIIYLFLIVKGVYSYKHCHYKDFICVVYLLITDCLGLFPQFPLHGRDCALLLFILCIIYLKASGKRLVEREDSVGKVILFLLLWFLTRTIITVINGTEGFIKAFMVFRFDLFYLCYYVFKRIPYEEIQRSIPFLLITTIIGSVVMFYAYFNTGKFLAVSPGAVEICFFTAMLYKKMKYRKVALLITSILLLLGTSRGVLIAIPVSLLLYFLTKYRHRITFSFKHVIVLGLVVALAGALIINKLSKDVGKGDGLKDEMTIVMEMMKYRTYDSYDHSMVSTVGTFAFRAALLAERIEYMLNHPMVMLFGVGAMHEDTAQKVFSFNLGTYRTVGDMEQGQIDTGDVSFIMEWLRYGVVYFILFISIAVTIFKTLRRYDYLLCSVAFVLFLELFLRSLTSAPFLGSEFNLYYILLVTASVNKFSPIAPLARTQSNQD